MQTDTLTNQNSSSENKNQPTLPYAKVPMKNPSLRESNKEVQLISNLMTLSFPNNLKKIHIYSIEILPQINDYSLLYKIMKIIENPLSKHFPIKSISGLNLFTSISNPPPEIIIKEEIEKVQYKITFSYAGIFDFEKIFDKSGINLKKKQFLEKLIKNILLSCKGTIRFGDDRTIVKLSKENVNQIENSNEMLYKGFYTSAQITESGLYLQVLNMNKYISGKTMYEKILEIRNENCDETEQNLQKKIEDYIFSHRTVLTMYGSFRAYKISYIDFEKTPLNTTFNIKTNEGMKTITIDNYFYLHYKIKIKNKNQPLLIVINEIKNKKFLKNDKKNNFSEENIIHLVPELVYITGIDFDNKNSIQCRRDIISKTKTNPSQRMCEINKIRDIYNSENSKEFKQNGSNIKSKSSKEISEEWGINIGENLKLFGRTIPQPVLNYANKKINTNNGIFRSENILDAVNINKNNFIYIYDNKDKVDFKYLLNGLFNKARQKGINVSSNANEIKNIIIYNTYTWEDVKNDLNKINLRDRGILMAMVFLSNSLEKYYNDLKEYFTNDIKIYTQFAISRKLNDQKRAGSIMFNIVEQINIKMGGQNFYIDFFKEGILDSKKIYLIIGLESKIIGDSIDYVMTCTMNTRLNKNITIPRNCKNNNSEKQKIIFELMNEAFKGMREIGKAPHPPDHIILYRQGGNEIQNKKLLKNEIPFFVNFLKEQKKLYDIYKKYDTKLTYICCNLKSELKFFEIGNDQKFYNPTSGLCVDSKVTQKNKYEFYLQPQYVNQGTATPCHYEVLYQDLDNENIENNIKMENLQKLSFYLSFYYWTWSGAVRVPGVLKLSTTAIEYYSKCLKNKLNLPGNFFRTPAYV